MKRIKVNENDIVDSFDACPYCCKPKAETWHMCCSEVHTERAYELTNGDTLLESEIELDKGNSVKQTSSMLAIINQAKIKLHALKNTIPCGIRSIDDETDNKIKNLVQFIDSIDKK